MNSVRNTYLQIASSNMVQLNLSLDPNLRSMYLVDPLRLSQILNNFVSNAIKFSRDGTVELKVERIKQNDDVDTLQFSVIDTGIGIDKETQSTLFANYIQASEDTARMFGGTGLGLAICKQLADLLKGKITLESEQGKGSTFSFTIALPATDITEEKISQPNTLAHYMALRSHCSDVSVLVVDDHPTNRKLITLQLELLSIHADMAENGKIGLQLWQEQHYPLIITDCHMPEMDGYRLAKAIRQIEKDESLPASIILGWTASISQEERDRCLAAGMNELMIKPINLSDLAIFLTDWLNPKGIIIQPINSEDYQQIIHPLFDTTTLIKMVGNNPELINEIILDYKSSMQTLVQEICHGLEFSDWKIVRSAAHRLKSSSLAVGAISLGNVCTELLQNHSQLNIKNDSALIISDINKIKTELLGSFNKTL